jgi:hypothetical protein
VGIFPNEGAITRLVGALLLEQSEAWALRRRYMQLEGLQTLTDSAVRSGMLGTSPIAPDITTRTPRPGTRSLGQIWALSVSWCPGSKARTRSRV